MTGSADAIGLDIGGTTLKAVRVGAGGAAAARTTVPAGGAISRTELLDIVDATVGTLAGSAPIARIGVAVGGIVRPDGSMPADATNLPNLADVPLTSLFADRYGVPCTVVNDAHAAMHGEAWCGAARGLANALMVTFGTGLGGGLMLDGRVRRGPRGRAGEIGVWPVIDGSGALVSLEDLVAPVRFERRHGRVLVDALLDTNDDPEGRAARDAIGRALAAAHVLLDLEAIIIGGGIAAVGEPLRACIATAVHRACPQTLHQGLVVRLGILGAYAGAIGAVAPVLNGEGP